MVLFESVTDLDLRIFIVVMGITFVIVIVFLSIQLINKNNELEKLKQRALEMLNQRDAVLECFDYAVEGLTPEGKKALRKKIDERLYVARPQVNGVDLEPLYDGEADGFISALNQLLSQMESNGKNE